MTWTPDKPTRSGWHFYRESGKNTNKPMSDRVHMTRPFVFVSLFAPHTDIPGQESGQTKDFKGEWWGPVGPGAGAGMNGMIYKKLTMLVSSRKGRDDRWIPEARVEISKAGRVTSYRVPMDPQHGFPTESEAEAEAKNRPWPGLIASIRLPALKRDRRPFHGHNTQILCGL